ncbi:MAG: hypothetical protein JJU18_05110 [Oceanicaulis sp.]|nr:hypothetical protein [Oceanicaulis sp.]
MSCRALMLEDLSRAIARLRPAHTCRVAVDGRTASGKTTLADELGAALRALGRPVIRTSVDRFHRPRAERYRRGRFSAQGYLDDARDLQALQDMLLHPLGPDGDGRFQLESFDLEADRPAHAPLMTAEPGSVLIVDGSFLQRPVIDACWDVTVFVEVSEAIAEARGLARDANTPDAQRLYAERYMPAFRLYDARRQPAASADAVWNNEAFDAPVLQIRPAGRLQP